MVSCMASSVFLLSFSLLLASSFIYNRIYCFLNTQFFSRMSFTSDRSYFRNGDAFYSIKSSYNLLDEKNNLVYASALNHSQVVVLPKLPHITLELNLKYGGVSIKENNFSKGLQQTFDIKLWSQFNFTSEVISRPETSLCAFLKCKLFNKESRYQMDPVIKSEDYEIIHFDTLKLEFEYYPNTNSIDFGSQETTETPRSEEFNHMLQVLNYIIFCRFIELEKIYPLVFSTFGRMSFENNYTHSILLANIFSDTKKLHSKLIKKLENNAKTKTLTSELKRTKRSGAKLKTGKDNDSPLSFRFFKV